MHYQSRFGSLLLFELLLARRAGARRDLRELSLTTERHTFRNVKRYFEANGIV
jgi:hypothetical protein